MAKPASWDIFCRVVDNYGDAGVCWRLARRLAAHGSSVRVWIDDLTPLQRLHPGITRAIDQSAEGVRVLKLHPDNLQTPPAEVAIEAFGCGLPAEYIERMREAARRPLWIVVEYLSAESWVRTHHGLPSPHPNIGVDRYFFFPGFEQGTGGLLRETGLFARRDSFTAPERRAFWESIDHTPPAARATTISLFAYDMAPIAELLDVWERSPSPLVVAVPEAQALSCVLTRYGLSAVPRGRVIRRGLLELRVVPFVPQARYDELLWSCDINFVRGEDSFVRAQWAGRPFVWQIYPQEAQAHWAKLEAFLTLYGEGAPERARSAAAAMMRSWNRAGRGLAPLEVAWSDFIDQQDAVARHTRDWADRVAAVGDLADNLVSFCTEKLK